MSKIFYGHTDYKVDPDDDAVNEHPVYGEKAFNDQAIYRDRADVINTTDSANSPADNEHPLYGNKFVHDVLTIESAPAFITESDSDPVNSPAHYADSAIECIDIMRGRFGDEQVRMYAKICAFKYLWRSQHKHFKDHEDLAKAEWYIRYANGHDPREDL